MELKPTEGEWTAYKRPVPVGYADWEIHWSPIGECVAEVVHTEADARLMAASKELLAALQMAVRQNSHDMLMTGEELRKCEFIIAKATRTAP